MKIISSAHISGNAIHSDMESIEICWHGSAGNKVNDSPSIPSTNQPIFGQQVYLV